MSNIHTIHDSPPPTKACQAEDTHDYTTKDALHGSFVGHSSTYTVTKPRLTNGKLPVESQYVAESLSQQLKEVRILHEQKRNQPTESTEVQNNSEISDETNGEVASIPAQGFHLSLLTEDHVIKLSSRIDQLSSSGIHRWEYIIEKMIPENAERNKIVPTLRQAQHGGGNPALRFLESLEIMEDSPTKKRFCDVAGECKRFDVPRLPFIQKLQDTTILMSALSMDDKLTLAGKLTKQGIANDWKHFADKFGYTKEDKDRISQTINVPNIYSPTKRLIDILIEKDKTTNDLKSVCQDLRFQQTVNFILDIEREILTAS